MRTTRRLWLLLRPFQFELVLTILSAFIGGLLIIAQAGVLSRVVTDVFLGRQSLSAETVFFRLLILVVFLRSFLVWGNEVSANRLATKFKATFRQKLFDALLDLGPLYTRGQRAGELANTLFEGVESLGVYFGQYIPQLILAALVPLAILLFIFPRDVISGIVLLVTAPLIPIFLYLIGKGAEIVTRRQWETLSTLSAFFLDSLQGLATLKIFGRSRERTREIGRTSNQFREMTLKVLRVTFLSALVLEMVATISTAMVAVEVSLRLLYGQMDFQQAFFLLLLAPEFYLPLRMLGTRFHAGMAGLSAARRVFEIMDEPRPAPMKGPRGVDPLVPFESVRLEDVCYSYPTEPQPVLTNVSLEIQCGAHVALVGLSGTGKSTLAALLMGWMMPSTGEILLNSCAPGNIPLEAWRGMFAWVPQRPHLFHDSLAANLRIARPDATLAELEGAVRTASLKAFVHALPQGFDTVIGEAGARLSGGEAQRLALARAFLKNAPVLILDEPTSNLDPATETELVESIHRLMEGRTVITIAHRLNTIIQADRIYVLDHGRLVESGTHQSLRARSGAYRRLVGEQIETPPEEPPITPREKSPLPALTRSPELFSSFPSTFESSTRYPLFNTFSRLLSFLRGSWRRVALSVLLGGLTVASNAGLMGTAAYLMSMAALHPQFGALQIAIVGVRFFGISRGVFRYTERLVSHDVTFRLLARLRTWFYQCLEPLAPARLLHYRSGDLLSRIIADVQTLENFYVRALAPPFVAIVIAVGMSFFLAGFDARLAWVYLFFLAFLGVVLPLLSWKVSRRSGDAFIIRRAALQSRLVDGIHGLADLLAFHRGPGFLGQIAAAENDFGRAQAASASIGGLFNALTLLGLNLGVISVLAESIPLVGSDRIFGSMLAAIMLVCQAGFEAVLPLSATGQALSSCSRAADRLFEVVDAPPEVADSASAIAVKAGIPTLRCANLGFTYPGRSTPALEAIDLQLKPGMRVAVVGPSGSGKSTLFALLIRFWEYSQGQIELNGLGLRGYTQESVRQQFSVVPQRSAFFDGTILENLLPGRPSARESDVLQAARKAGIIDFIAGLPQGLSTNIGERAMRLSGGEAQRLALARAFLNDAPIYLLDEPTANLDPFTERLVLNSLFASLNDRSLLLMTHRLVGLERMDEIIVLDQGRIVERGAHADLLSRDCLYRRLWERQERLVDMKMQF